MENVIKPSGIDNSRLNRLHMNNMNSFRRLSSDTPLNGIYDKFGDLRLRLAIIDNHEFKRGKDTEFDPLNGRYVLNTNTGKIAIKWIDLPRGVLRPSNLGGEWRYERHNDSYNPENRDYNEYSIKSRREMVELTHPFLWSNYENYCGFNYLPPVGSIIIVGFRKQGIPLILGYLNSNFKACYPSLKPGEMTMKGFGNNYSHWRWSDKIDINAKSIEGETDLDDPDHKQKSNDGLPVKKNLANSELWLRLNGNDRYIEMIAKQNDISDHKNDNDSLRKQLEKHGFINEETKEQYDKYFADKTIEYEDGEGILSGKWLDRESKEDIEKAISKLEKLSGSHGSHTTRLVLQPRSLFIESKEEFNDNFNESKNNDYGDHHHERCRITKYYQDEQRIHTYANKITPSLNDKQIEWIMLRDHEADIITQKAIKKNIEDSRKIEINSFYGNKERNEDLNDPENELIIEHDINYINSDGKLLKRTNKLQNCYNIDEHNWEYDSDENLLYDIQKQQTPQELNIKSIKYESNNPIFKSIKTQKADSINKEIEDIENKLITTINQEYDNIIYESLNRNNSKKTKREQKAESIIQTSFDGTAKTSTITQEPTKFEIDVPGDFIVKSEAGEINLSAPSNGSIGKVDIGNSSKETNITGQTINIAASPNVNIGGKVHLAGGGPPLARIGDPVVVTGALGIPIYHGFITGGSTNSDSN